MSFTIVVVAVWEEPAWPEDPKRSIGGWSGRVVNGIEGLPGPTRTTVTRRWHGSQIRAAAAGGNEVVSRISAGLHHIGGGVAKRAEGEIMRGFWFRAKFRPGSLELVRAPAEVQAP